MSEAALSSEAVALISDVLRRHPRVSAAILFGSRAKGTHTAGSDVDLAVEGNVSPLEAEAIAGDLEELPLPFRFEVQPLAAIRHEALREHIARVGIAIYRAA